MSGEPHAPAHALETIRAFLTVSAAAPGIDGYVLGLSGGIDSALVARLARDAVGPARVLGVLLPDDATDPALIEETRRYAGSLGIAHQTHPIGPIERAVRTSLGDRGDRATWGNAKARIRMLLLYSIARERGRLVLGTGNKSELLLGYFTKYGDGGVDLLPIGDLYKTGVRELAAALELPAPVRERAPTAGLWEGQTDEGELGLPYERIDRILYAAERLIPEAEIPGATGEPRAAVASVLGRLRASRHKRRSPPIPKVSFRTVGLDWRE